MSDDNGPLVTQAYVCKAKGDPLVLEDIILPPLTPTQVELDLTHCGLCHTDIHMRGTLLSDSFRLIMKKMIARASIKERIRERKLM